MSHQDGYVYKMLSARPLAGLHAKLDLIWHLFSSINILFWWENSLAVPWTARAQRWMMPEMEEGVFIFSWLSTCRAEWNGLAIVYKFFWSDPSLWTHLSWPWPLRPLSYWPAAAVYTVCHVHILKPMNPNYQCFSLPGLLIYILLWGIFFWPQHFCGFLCRHIPFALSGICTSHSCTLVSLKKPQVQFHCSMPHFLCPSRVNWVRSSWGYWCVSELQQKSDLLLDGLIHCSRSEVLVHRQRWSEWDCCPTLP